VSADSTLRDRDRVELLRPLAVDPKEARRLRYRGQSDRFADRRR
jgi:putative ubiquitin-RnfH superfamily antitoxin RatB of RatAB toxin-antitoxin module